MTLFTNPGLISIIFSLSPLVYIFLAILSDTAKHAYISMSVVLLSYDHILTLGLEIRLIWHRPFQIVTIAFLVNRYLSLIINVVRLAIIFERLTPGVFFLFFLLLESTHLTYVLLHGSGIDDLFGVSIKCSNVIAHRCQVINIGYGSLMFVSQLLMWGKGKTILIFSFD
jgi:hypothetical protein